MKFIRIAFSLSFIIGVIVARAESFQVVSPDKSILISISNNEGLNYSITFKGREIIRESKLGLEFKNEPPMVKRFSVLEKQEKKYLINLSWIDKTSKIIKSIEDNYFSKKEY